MSTTGSLAVSSALLRATAMTNSDDDFETLLQSTRRAFRPNNLINKPGRKKAKQFKRCVMLLRRSNVDFLPSQSEIEFLTDRGLGKFKNALFERNWSIEQIENYIISLYQKLPLGLVGFKYCRVKKNRELQIINNAENAIDLFEKLGQGMLVIVPNRDLPVELRLTNNIVINEVESNQINREETIIEATTQANIPRRNENKTHTENEPFSNFIPQTRQPQLIGTAGFQAITSTSMVANSLYEDNFQTSNDWEIEMATDSFSVFNLPTLNADADIMNIYIDRHDCVNVMIELYRSEDIINKRLIVEFIGESGADVGGLTKELFNIFWRNVESTYFAGEDCIVPYLPLHRIKKESDNFVIFGRIFSHMLLLTGTLPPKFSRTLYLSLGNIPVSNNILQEDLLLFVSPVESIILKKGLSDFKSLTTSEKEIIANIFCSYQYFDNPNEIDFRDQLNTIANEIFIERPKMLVSKFKNGLPKYMTEKFWEKCTVESLIYLLATYRPTTRKILDCIKTNEFLNNDENKVLHYLNMFIGSLNKDDLLQFLFFVTGSFAMSTDVNITVSFNSIKGNLRRPISHTCSNLLELSTTYSSYQEFKNEMNLYLNSTYSYEYTQA